MHRTLAGCIIAIGHPVIQSLYACVDVLTQLKHAVQAASVHPCVADAKYCLLSLQALGLAFRAGIVPLSTSTTHAAVSMCEQLAPWYRCKVWRLVQQGVQADESSCTGVHELEAVLAVCHTAVILCSPTGDPQTGLSDIQAAVKRSGCQYCPIMLPGTAGNTDSMSASSNMAATESASVQEACQAVSQHLGLPDCALQLLHPGTLAALSDGEASAERSKGSAPQDERHCLNLVTLDDPRATSISLEDLPAGSPDTDTRPELQASVDASTATGVAAADTAVRSCQNVRTHADLALHVAQYNCTAKQLRLPELSPAICQRIVSAQQSNQRSIMTEMVIDGVAIPLQPIWPPMLQPGASSPCDRTSATTGNAAGCHAALFAVQAKRISASAAAAVVSVLSGQHMQQAIWHMEIDCAHFEVSEDSLASLAQAVLSLPCLQTFQRIPMECLSVSQDGALTLASAQQSASDASCKAFGPLGSMLLVRQLHDIVEKKRHENCSAPSPIKLDLAGCCLGASGCKLLASCFTDMGRLSNAVLPLASLGLKSTQPTTAGLQAWFDSCIMPPVAAALTFLDLSSTGLGSCSMDGLQQALQRLSGALLC